MTTPTSQHPTSLSWKLGLNMPMHRRVFASFFLYSFCFGGFFPRLAEIQRSMGVGEGALGLALVGVAAGTLVSLTFGGPLVERIGHRRVFLYLLPVLPVFYALAAVAPTPVWMFVCLFPAGLMLGAIEVGVNLEADRAEHATGRRIMNRSHAFWSIGFFTAAALGSLMAYLEVSPLAHLLGVVLASCVLTTLLLGKFEVAPQREADHQHADVPVPKFSVPSGPILLLVLVTLPAMVLEGAGFDWSAIYMRDIFSATPFMGGVAVATGAAAQAFTRYVADRFVERYSPVLVTRCLLSVLAVGCLLVYLTLSPALSLLGFALMGMGSSAIFPLAMSAAAQRTDRPSHVNVAALAQTAFVSFLLAPPLLGFVAQHFGIQWAFGVALPLIVLSLVLSSAIGASGQYKGASNGA
jgi:MFS family permease